MRDDEKGQEVRPSSIVFSSLAFLMPRGITAQMSAVLVALVVLPLLALGGILIRTSQEAVRTTVHRDHEQLAVRAASEVGTFIERPKGILNAAAAILGTMSADAWHQETVLVELSVRHEDLFGRISLSDLAGRETASSDPGTPPLNWGADAAFQSAAGGKPAMSEVYLSDRRLPHVRMAVPVRRLGRTDAVLSAEVNLRSLWDIVDNIRIGQTGSAFAVTGGGILLAHPDKKKVLRNEDLSGLSWVSGALQGRTGSREAEDDGRNWLFSYAPVQGLNWAVVVRQSAAEAFAFSEKMRAQSWVLMAVAALAAILASFLISRELVRPIRVLIAQTGRVTAGDFDHPIPVRRSDEIGRLLESFNRMTLELGKARRAERLAIIGQAATAIVHDLKNSLIMANTFIGLLPERHRDRDFVERFSRVVPQEMQSCQNMLQDLSDFSKGAAFDMSEVDVAALIEDFSALAVERLMQNKVRLDIRTPDALPCVRGHAGKLKQVLMNLVLNALDAMPRGGVLSIDASRIADGQGLLARELVEITVRDTGRGIPPDRLERIFEPFRSTNPNSLGLGLAICKEIIERHGGTIAVRPSDTGTLFVIRLPSTVTSPV